MIRPSDASTAPSREESESMAPLHREEVQRKAAGNGNSARGSASPRDAAIPDPEVSALPKRRRFSADYKARVVEEAETCTEPGAIGALLRREGLYSSQLSSWRALYRTGALQALRDDKRGRKTKKHPLEDEVAQLRKQNERLSCRLEQAETIIEIQKKVASMLGIPLNSVENEDTK
jgi:transposase-like protein